MLHIESGFSNHMLYDVYNSCDGDSANELEVKTMQNKDNKKRPIKFFFIFYTPFPDDNIEL